MRVSVFLAAALLVAFSLGGSAAAANVSPPTASPPAQPAAQSSSASVTILRGSVSPRPLPLPPFPIIPYDGTSYPPPTAPSLGPGWDTGGFDRNFDWDGTDPAFAPVR